MTQTISIKDTRDNLADIINKVDAVGDSFIITKFGKAKAMIIPISQSKLNKSSKIQESFGVWGDRKDIKDSNAWVADKRAKMSTRYE